MKFNKTLVAVAIAGIAAAPTIASADTTLSGVVQVKVNGDDTDAGDLGVGASDVRFQIVSEHELNSGLTGYGSLQYNLDKLSGAPVDIKLEPNPETGDLEATPSGFVGADNVYVGIKGGFGDFRMGEVPVMAEYGQVANDIHDLTDAVNGGLSYTGSFGPVSLGVAYAPEPNEDSIGVGVKFGLGGFSIGVGGEDRGGQTNASVGASFALAGASVAAHYWVRQPEGDGDDITAMAVKVGYGFGGVSAGLTFSQLDGGDDFESKIRLDLGYDLGGGLELSTRINMNADKPDTEVVGEPVVKHDDVTDYRIQLSKSF